MELYISVPVKVTFDNLGLATVGFEERDLSWGYALDTAHRMREFVLADGSVTPGDPDYLDRLKQHFEEYLFQPQ